MTYKPSILKVRASDEIGQRKAKPVDITQRRLVNQQLIDAQFTQPAEVVEHLRSVVEARKEHA